MRLTSRLFLTLLAVLGVATVASLATFSAFSSTATTGRSSFQAGTVVLTSNASGQAVFSDGPLKPGDTQQKCIAVQYAGSLPASVRLYATVSGNLAGYLTTTIERGSFSGPAPGAWSCGGFVPDRNGPLYIGKLRDLPTDWSSGISDPQATWATGDSAIYRVSVSQDDDSAAQGQTATATLTAEARSN